MLKTLIKRINCAQLKENILRQRFVPLEKLFPSQFSVLASLLSFPLNYAKSFKCDAQKLFWPNISLGDLTTWHVSKDLNVNVLLLVVSVVVLVVVVVLGNSLSS